MIRRILTVAVAVAVGVLAVTGQRTTRKGRLRPVAPAATATAVCDTVRADSLLRRVAVTGYEKPMRATRETMFVTSRLSVPVIGVIVEIEYMTVDGSPLHKRTVTLPTDLPAAIPNEQDIDQSATGPDKGTTIQSGACERRMVAIRSWDVNHLFYYHLNVPARTTGQGTPYRVRLRTKALLIPRN